MKVKDIHAEASNYFSDELYEPIYKLYVTDKGERAAGFCVLFIPNIGHNLKAILKEHFQTMPNLVDRLIESEVDFFRLEEENVFAFTTSINFTDQEVEEINRLFEEAKACEKDCEE